MEQTTSIKILDKTLRLLSLFGPETPDWGVTEISDHAGLPKSTVYRILRVLVEHEMLAQDPVSKRFRLGLGALELGRHAYEGIGLRDLALPVLRATAARSGETVTLQVLNQVRDRVVCIERAQQSSGLHLIMEIGNTAPLHAGSSSKALLAFLSPDEIEAVIARGLDALTPHTITDPDELRSELAQVREQGYAFSLEETDLGAAGVSVPVVDAREAVVASLTIAGPVTRLNEHTRDIYVRYAFDAALAISNAQGVRYALGPKEAGDLSVSRGTSLRMPQPHSDQRAKLR